MNHISPLFFELVAFSGNEPQEYQYIKVNSEWKKAFLQIAIAVFSLFLIPLFYHIKKHTELNRSFRQLEKENTSLKSSLITKTRKIQSLEEKTLILQQESRQKLLDQEEKIHKKLTTAQENFTTLAQKFHEIDHQNNTTISLYRNIYDKFRSKSPVEQFLLPHSEDSAANKIQSWWIKI